METDLEDAFSKLAVDFNGFPEVDNPSDVAQLLPFLELSGDALQDELWVDGRHKQWGLRLDNWPKGRDRGNYVKSTVLMNLRMEAQSTRIQVAWKSLEAMWTYLPNELIALIFGLLHPIDLYHVVRATKGLRRFLLDKNSASIWNESFFNHPDIPFYPADVSAPVWVSLIFGPATCDSCGTDNSLVEYALRRRICVDCAASDYGDEDDRAMMDSVLTILKDFVEEIDVVWRLAVKVYRYSPIAYPDESFYEFEPSYSIKQVKEVTTKMREYLLDIQAGVPDAKTRYEAYIDATEAASQRRFEHAKFCNLWANGIYTRSHAAFLESIPPFCNMVSEILLTRGYDPRDVSSARDEFTWTLNNGWSKVTDYKLSKSKLWKYLPMLEAMTIECRATRLERERKQRVNVRKGKVAGLYHRLARESLNYQALCYVPSVYEANYFANYINDPQETIVELDIDIAQQEILRFVDEFLVAKKRRLFKLLLYTGFLPKEANENSEPEDFLGLAIALFQCCGRTFIGWEEAAAHMCRVDGVPYSQDARDDKSFSFCFGYSGFHRLQNVASILGVADSLKSLLPKDLDALNKRFVCKNCDFVHRAGLYGLSSLTWRECVGHAVKEVANPTYEHSDPHDTAPVFDILSESLTENILALEQPFPPPSDRIWICKHCTTFINPQTKSEAATHAHEVHGILKPTVNVDFAFLPTELSPIRSPVFIGLDEKANHRCLRCPRSHKLWPKKDPDLDRHLLDKHHIETKDLVEGVDWMKLRVVEDESWILEKIIPYEI